MNNKHLSHSIELLNNEIQAIKPECDLYSLTCELPRKLKLMSTLMSEGIKHNKKFHNHMCSRLSWLREDATELQTLGVIKDNSQKILIVNLAQRQVERIINHFYECCLYNFNEQSLVPKYPPVRAY